MNTEERKFCIDTMTWSFSRLNSFDNCKLEWLLRYIEEPNENNVGSCYAQFGSLCHSLLENYANGEIGLWDLPNEFERLYPQEVTEYFPRLGGKDYFSEYLDKGIDYFSNFEGFDGEILGVEKKVEFEIEGFNFIGFIDLLLKQDDKIIILDHKSSTLKFKKDGNLSKTSLPKFDEFKKQLYLYSIPILEEYGHVDKLVWNLFKDQNMIEIPWKQEEFEEAKKWAVDSIRRIRQEETWEPRKYDFMYCNYLCSKRIGCPYRDQKEFIPE